MNASLMQAWFRQHRDLRVGPEMSQYVLRRWQAGRAATSSAVSALPPQSITVLGAEARTGRPVRVEITADMMARAIGDSSRQVT